MLILDDPTISDIDKQKVFETIGYSDSSVVPPRVSALVEEFAENSVDFLDPSYSYIIKDIQSVQGKHVTIEDSITFHSQTVARVLEQCQKVAIFALTIGDGLESIVAGLAADGSMVKASVLDAIASHAAENLAGLVDDRISEEMRNQGLATSRRFSPGYCDWDVSQQEMVFKALEGNSTGINLTEDYLMLPRKSISGIIGIGDDSSNVDTYNPCRTCLRDCLTRRV